MNKIDIANQVLAHFPAEEIRKRNEDSFLIKFCPFCGKMWKLNICPSKLAFRCPACDGHGNLIELFSKLKNISYEQAKEQLKVPNYTSNKFITSIVTKNNKVGSIIDRTLVYFKLLQEGRLEQKHKDELLKRGLKENDLKYYVSCSSLQDVNAIFEGCNRVFVDDWKTKKVSYIPGFYGVFSYDVTNDKEVFEHVRINVGNEGYLIPIINHEERLMRISCFQIRHDNFEPKYTFFTSSGKKGGISVSGCEKIHFTRNFWRSGQLLADETVFLTEGPLKADVASTLSGKQFIAIPGVNSVGDLKSELFFLKENGCKRIAVCLDMDYQTNENVKKALEKVFQIIDDAGLDSVMIKWDAKYKGIDDFLLSKKK